MDRERAERRDDHHEDSGRYLSPDETRYPTGEARGTPTGYDGGTTPAAPGPARKRTDEADRSPTWLEIMLPVLIVLLLATLAMLWNIVAAVVIFVLGIGVILSWVVQKRQPHEPGE